MTILQIVLNYAKTFSVIPVGKDKKPFIKWEPFQKEKATEKQVKEWWSKFPNANVGIITGQLSNIMVIDTDTSEATKKIQDLLPEGFETPIQKTPSGGMHFFFQYESGYLNRARIAKGTDLRTEGGFIVVDPSINGTGKKWQWLEGLSILEIASKELPSNIKDYIKEYAIDLYRGPHIFDSHKESQESQQVTEYFIKGRRDDDLFHVANCIIKGGIKDDIAMQVLEILALNCNPPFPLKEVKEKIESAIKRARRREINISEDLREWIEVTTGHFRVTDYHKESQVVTKEGKHAVIMAIKRLCDQGVVEKYGTERGVYRKVEKECQEINFLDVEDKPVQISWPFEIERYVLTYPKNVIVIAGVQNAGKTAFLLNTALMNMDKFKINYFSSEMGAMELKIRLQKFEVSLKKWKEVNFKERSSNFVDVIEPDHVNIIDFLELSDEFYKIAAILKEFYEKLKDGIAIIAIQKDPKKEYGRGGTMGLEKPRLYINMQKGKIEIIKAKNWADIETNPNGLWREFKLVQGAKFIMRDDWKRG